MGELDFGGLLGAFTYGATADRVPPRSNVIYRVNPEVPNGIEVVDFFESPHAADFDL
jgi:hypothetical protein